MEVSFQKVTSVTETVEVSEEDIATLKELALASFVDRVRVVGIGTPFLNCESKAKEICDRYGIDTSSKLGTSKSLVAALGVEEDLLRPLT